MSEENNELDVARLAEILARSPEMKAKDLASQLEVDHVVVRDQLLELEKLGIVYRTGATRGTRWWLG